MAKSEAVRPSFHRTTHGFDVRPSFAHDQPNYYEPPLFLHGASQADATCQRSRTRQRRVGVINIVCESYVRDRDAIDM